MNKKTAARALAFSIDQQYVMPLEVLFDSLVRTNSVPEHTPIFILHGQSLTETAQNQLQAFIDARGHSVSFVLVDDSLLGDTILEAGDHVSVATYFRLFLASLLPNWVDEVLYLDADLLVVQSIQELFEIPIHQALAAVDHFSPPMSIALWGAQGGDYFQAGVLLINLRLWREKNLQERFLHTLKTEKQRIRFWDQCVLNYSLEGQWGRLPLYYNVCYGTLPLVDNPTSIKILHYDGKGKPWGEGYFRKLASHWHKAYIKAFGKPFAPGWSLSFWKKALLFYIRVERGIKLAFWR